MTVGGTREEVISSQKQQLGSTKKLEEIAAKIK